MSNHTAEPTVMATIAATAVPILEFGRSWMASPLAVERGGELGMPQGFGFWVNGRAGALGDVGPDVAAAAIGFMAPALVTKMWEGRPSSMSAMDAADAFAALAAEWSRPVLTAALNDDELTELVGLCDAVAEAALPSTGALFTGWRAMKRPGDPAGDAAVAMNVVRELRGGAHLIAAHAVGLGPHGSIMSTDDPIRGGSSWAEVFGWTEPHPEPKPDLRAAAEQMTDEICAPAYQALDGAQRQRFVALVERARAAIDD
jgi:hypothetical protein